MTQESLPSLITLEKICVALGVTLSQFFREKNPVDLTESQKEILKIWDNLSTKEQETVLAMLRGFRNEETVQTYMFGCFFFCANKEQVSCNFNCIKLKYL